MSESKEQKAVVKFFRTFYQNFLIYAVPNGAWLHGDKLQRIKQIAKMKAEGLEPGIPDLFIAVARGGFHGLFIEMKDRGLSERNLSKPQKEK